MSPFMLTGDAANVPFTLANACKDLGYYCVSAGESGAPHRIADTVAEMLEQAVSGGHGQDYVPQLAGLLKRGEGTGSSR